MLPNVTIIRRSLIHAHKLETSITSFNSISLCKYGHIYKQFLMINNLLQNLDTINTVIKFLGAVGVNQGNNLGHVFFF